MNDDSIATHTYCHVLSVLLTGQEKKKSVCSAFYGGLFPDPGRVAYNVNTMNGCEHYKVGQFQRRKDSLTLLTHSL